MSNLQYLHKFAKKALTTVAHDVIMQHPFVLVTTLYLAWCIYVAYAGTLRDIPGPFVAKFSRLWQVWQIFKGDMEKTNILLHNKHGQQFSATEVDH